MENKDISVDVIAALIRKQLGRKLSADVEISATSKLEDLGMSSLDFTEVYFAIEERIGFELDPAAAADVATVGDLLAVLDNLISAHAGEASSPATTA